MTVRAQAERGDPGAEAELGHLYYHGLGVAADYSQAVTWFRKAADKASFIPRISFPLAS